MGCAETHTCDPVLPHEKWIGDRELVDLGEFAEKFHTSRAKIHSELEQMIRQHYFLQGHINQEFPCFITTDQKYKEYLQVLDAWEQEKENGKNLDLMKKKEKLWNRRRTVWLRSNNQWR